MGQLESWELIFIVKQPVQSHMYVYVKSGTGGLDSWIFTSLLGQLTHIITYIQGDSNGDGLQVDRLFI